MTPETALDQGIGELALALPAGAAEQLLAYLRLLGKWNRTYNLTAIRDPQRMVTHHLLDSLAVLPHLPLGDAAHLADVGSGGGLPGVPLAIARPAWHIALNDRSEKKAAFLRQVAIELGLSNVSVHGGRVQDWQPAQRFALVISRAFAELSEFVARCRHLVAPGGALAAMRGAAPVDADGCEVIALRVPLVDAQRHLVLCRVGG